MPVKHWSRAGLILTYWCTARCASCYLGCGPDRGEDMPADMAIELWRQLAIASPHGCRVHLTGGEPFGNWDKLIEICRRARENGLSAPGGRGPLEKVETNAFWADNEAIIRQRVQELDRAGIGKLGISADPYHQQFVPIENCRLLARAAGEILGPKRVQVRWRDWLESGADTGGLDESTRMKLFARYGREGRDRLAGRAGGLLAGAINDRSGQEDCKKFTDFADIYCMEPLLRSRHVHIDGSGRVLAGTCAGIVLGNASEGIARLWRRLREDHDARPIVGELTRRGPAGLAERISSEDHGFVPRSGYFSKCELCWHVRSYLASQSRYGDELGPEWLYRA